MPYKITVCRRVTFQIENICVLKQFFLVSTSINRLMSNNTYVVTVWRDLMKPRM